MVYKPDIIIRNNNNELVGLIEVKSFNHIDKSEAKNFVRNMVTNKWTDQAIPYLVLVNQEKGYLWKDVNLNNNFEPLLEFPMFNVVSKYEIKNQDDKKIGHRQLELIMLRWITKLTEITSEDNVTEEPEYSLLKVGFINDIHENLVLIGDKV